MRKTNRIQTALSLAALAAVTGLAGAGISALNPAPASAATTISWTARTCTAAHWYTRQATTARLNAMVTDSTHLGRSYLKADVASLYADVSSPSSKAGKYIPGDEKYIGEDCSAL